MSQNNDKVRKENARYRDKILFGGQREIVFKRDGHKCVQCGMTKQQHLEKFKQSLHIDHIDGNGVRKKNPNNALSNLQTLCKTCHMIKDGRRYAKLTKNDAFIIKVMKVHGIKTVRIAKFFNVDISLVCSIYNGTRWKDVHYDGKPLEPLNNLTEIQKRIFNSLKSKSDWALPKAIGGHRSALMRLVAKNLVEMKKRFPDRLGQPSYLFRLIKKPESPAKAG